MPWMHYAWFIGHRNKEGRYMTKYKSWSIICILFFSAGLVCCLTGLFNGSCNFLLAASVLVWAESIIFCCMSFRKGLSYLFLIYAFLLFFWEGLLYYFLVGWTGFRVKLTRTMPLRIVFILFC